MKKFIAIILSATTIFSCSTSVFADQTKTIEITQAMEIKNAKKNRIQSPTEILADNNQKVFVNDKQVELKEGSIVYENRLYLPVREIGDALGLEVGYVSEQKIVALDGGKIQLPVNENKAVVNGQIVAIDKENDKVGTIVVKDKTYLPVRFISENLGYNVSYDASSKVTHIKTGDNTNNNTTQNEGVTKLDKAQAVEAYKQLSEASNNIKNATVDSTGKMNFTMSDGTNSLSMKMDILSTITMDIKDKVSMYMEQKNTAELFGEKQVVEQKMFYKDGKMYMNQNVDGTEVKYKLDLDLDEAMQLSNTISANDLLDEEIILDGSVKNLENGNKQYSFNLNMDKAVDIAKQFTKDLQLGEEDLKDLDSIKFNNTNIYITVDSKNQPINSSISFDMQLTAEGFDVKANINMDMKYKNIGTTVVNIPNEDLTKYEDLKDLVVETEEVISK